MFIVLLKTFVLVEPDIVIPNTDADTFVEESVFTAFPFIFIIAEVLEHEIPVTDPPVPVEEIPLIVLFEILKTLAALAEFTMYIQIIVPGLVILVIVLLDILAGEPPTYPI